MQRLTKGKPLKFLLGFVFEKSKPAATLAYRPFRPVAPVFRALPATKLVAKPKSIGAGAEGDPLGGGRADQRAGLTPRSGEAQGWAGAHTR
jgi:hypothetical protein